MRKLWPHKWFSILIALWITVVLMIVVTGLAIMYAKEFKISRLSYDEVLSQSAAEGMFEYGMLKIRNHADGFQDAVDSEKNSQDKDILKLLTPRSEWMQMKYEILWQAKNKEFTLSGSEFLVIPLSVGTDDSIGEKSLKPLKNEKSEVASNLKVKGISDKVLWTISAMNGEKSVWLQGKWEISTTTEGIMQLTNYHCTDLSGPTPIIEEKSEPCGFDPNDEKKQELQYSYQVTGSVGDFMKPGKKNFGTGNGQQIDVEYSDFYLILYNIWNDAENVKISADSPFALPQYIITATASKGDASQIFEWKEDKSRMYDVLKYGYYDPTN